MKKVKIVKTYLGGTFEAWYENGKRMLKCGYCGKTVSRSIVPHVKDKHPDVWKDWCERFLELRGKGLSYKKIMKKFDTLFTWSVIEREIVRMLGDRIIPFKKVEIKQWEPENFKLEETTRWSFRRRGNWANHTGQYRGNWPPQIPRNLIERYTEKHEVVLDPFVGGGTTLIECLLLGRSGIGIDINPFAVRLVSHCIKELKDTAKQTLHRLPEVLIEVRQGDARDLSFIEDETIDLICAHPPYADTIPYTNGIAGDLSQIHNIESFCNEMETVAKELYRVLKRGKKCAVLVGDMRRNGRLISLGFYTMQRFLKTGFETHEIIIKDQYQCMASGFWAGKRDFFRIAHEYLFIFKK